MKSFIITGLIILASHSMGFSQARYSGKVELGYLKFNSTMIDVDPGENWKGYYLNSDQNGVNVSLINGVKFKEKFFAGAGVGYINFEGINGIAIFSDFEYIPLKKRVSPILNTKIGYSHIWNQYENGTGTALVELGAGVNYQLYERMSVYIQSGFLLTQQSSLIPLKVGVHF